MMTSIIVVCYNNSQITKRCIESIERNTSDYELILIDNNSQDDTADLLRTFEGKHKIWINSLNIGYAPAVNQGIREAAGAKILILNNDVIVTPNWLDSMLPFSKIDQVVVPLSTSCYHGQEIQGVATDLNDDELAQVGLRVQEINRGKCKQLHFAAGFCMLFDKLIFHEIGLFEESLMLAADDFEFAIRMKMKDYHFVLSLGTVVLHLGHKAFNSDSDHAESLASLSWLNFAKKYPGVLISSFEEHFRSDGGPAYIYEPPLFAIE